MVGPDNYEAGWLRYHPDVCDQAYSWDNPPVSWVLNGSRFNTPNPRAGLGQPDIVVTTPFQPFGQSNQSRILPAAIPNGAVCSVALDDGGDPQVLAIGLHNPRGLAVDAFDHLYAVNDGMQLRGTRPILNDPDVLIHVSANRWYGWPDYTTHGHSVTELAYGPPISFLVKSGYSELNPLINAEASDPAPAQAVRGEPGGGVPQPVGGGPRCRSCRRRGRSPSSAAARSSPWTVTAGALRQRRPEAAGVRRRQGRPGRRRGGRQAHDFVFNTVPLPASRQPYGTVALERPCDVKFGPDGALYILDFGQMENDAAVPRYHNGTGAIYKLDAVAR